MAVQQLAPIRLEPIIAAAQFSVGLVRLQPTSWDQELDLSTCALIRFDRSESGEQIYCLLTRAPDLGISSPPPLAQASLAASREGGATGGAGPTESVPRAQQELSTQSVDRSFDAAREQEARRPEGHRSQRHILDNDPVVAPIAEANFEFACGARFDGLEIVTPFHCPQYGSVLLELSEQCVQSLLSMKLVFLPIRFVSVFQPSLELINLRAKQTQEFVTHSTHSCTILITKY